MLKMIPITINPVDNPAIVGKYRALQLLCVEIDYNKRKYCTCHENDINYTL